MKPVRSCSWIMFYKMLFDRFVGFAYLYTVLDMPRQIRIVCLHKVAVLCFVNNGKKAQSLG